ncbi:MAG: hypothetical protein AB2761_17630 [Candidatus Thiodiazotropha endolucinida]
MSPRVQLARMRAMECLAESGVKLGSDAIGHEPGEILKTDAGNCPGVLVKAAASHGV